jgi:hypothetical protein
MKRALSALGALSALAALAFVVGKVSPARAVPTPNDSGGHTHVPGVVTDRETCGTYVRGGEASGVQTDPGSYAYTIPSPLGLADAAAAVDHRWIQDIDGDFLVFDMGRPVPVVDLFPSIDHEPVPDEAIEATVYGSNDLGLAESSWATGDITTIFESGFAAAWISDDWVTRWSFSTSYRYIGVHWGGAKALQADGDVEIDAVCAPNRPPDCSGVMADPDLLWPPNHKYRLITVGGATDPDGDPVTLAITGVTQDEPLNGRADGNTSPDARLAADADQAKLRAERSGRKDGRVYRVAVSGSDGSGGTCTGTALVGVPHDRGGKRTPIDSSLVVNSLGP